MTCALLGQEIQVSVYRTIGLLVSTTCICIAFFTIFVHKMYTKFAIIIYHQKQIKPSFASSKCRYGLVLLEYP